MDFVCTLSSLAASGLNVGVLMYCKNRVDILFLRPSRFPSLTPLIKRSASLSINSIISWVSLQSCSWNQGEENETYLVSLTCKIFKANKWMSQMVHSYIISFFILFRKVNKHCPHPLIKASPVHLSKKIIFKC